MAKVFLYVGSHKTGTTGLQYALHASRDRLAAPPVWTDAQHAEAEARLAAWQILNAEALAAREARLQEPFDDPELPRP